jgi:hypothetical protein
MRTMEARKFSDSSTRLSVWRSLCVVTCLACGCGRSSEPRRPASGGTPQACFEGGGLRPISPPSFALLSSPQPQFHWEPSDQSVRLEICRDRACNDRVHEALGSGGTLRGPALHRGQYFWRLSGPNGLPACTTWQFFTMARGTRSLQMVRAADVNGDGFADALLVTRSALGGSRQVEMHLGGSSGLDGRPYMVTVAGAGSVAAVSPAGDLDGDGFGDVWVGFPSANIARQGPLSDNRGKVYLLTGSSDGLRQPSETVVAPEGEKARHFGDAIAAGSDLDGDTHPDLAVWAGGGTQDLGARPGGATPDPAAVFAFRWSRDGSQATLAIRGSNQSFAPLLSAGGDVDGDDFADVLTYLLADEGSPSHVGPSVYRGGPHGVTSDGAYHLLAEDSLLDVRMVTDANGDTLADIVLTSTTLGQRQRIYVYLGREGGPLPEPSQILELDAPNTAGRLVGAEDVNGDLLTDLVLANGGTISVFLGSGDGYRKALHTSFTIPIENLTDVVYAVGDWNGDGFADLVVSGLRQDGVARQFIEYLGGSTGLRAEASRMFTSQQIETPRPKR